MNDNEKLALVRAKLGDATRTSSVVVGGRAWTVHRAPSRACAVKPSDPAYYDALEAVQREVAADTSLRAAGIRHFVSDGGRAIVAVPDLPAIDVVELAKVGTHNGGAEDWRDVQALLRETIGEHAFDVVFADEAGLDVRSGDPVDARRARAWDGALLDRLESEGRWSDSYGFMLEEASESGLDPDAEADERGGGLVAAFIATTGSLRLWWD